MNRVRGIIASLMLLVILGALGFKISEKETLLKDGRLLLLKMAPVDPRSLMQGDYMALGYDASLFPDENTIKSLPYKGFIILTIHEKSVASFSRLDDGSPLLTGEVRVLYRKVAPVWRPAGLKYAAESYFFEEGQAARYEAARFVMVKLGESGDTLLVGLADEHGQQITTTP